MTTPGTNDIRMSAVDWVVRMANPAFADWDGFTAWLEADPAHLAAYEATLAAGDEADAALRAAPAAVTTIAPAAEPVAPRRYRARNSAAGGLIAAAIVGAVSWSIIAGQRPAPYVIETGPGEHRTITTSAGTIVLNGDTRLHLDRHDPHIATLDRGEAMFEVTHDADHPFRLRSGDAELQDIGTRFDVTRVGPEMRVAVAEGAVVYDPKGQAVRLDAGRMLTVQDGATSMELTQTAADGVGGWRDGRLAYARAPLSTVTADLSRALGVPITAAPDVATKRFTGVLSFGGDRARFLADLGPYLDVTARKDGDGWRLSGKPASLR